MSNGNGVSRGDRNRNARLNRLRELVPTANAIVGIDLADKKQMVVVTDHDSKVLAGVPSAAGPGIWVSRWTGQPSVQRGLGSLGRRCRASRPGTGGGCWVSWPRSGACLLCVCSRS